MLQNYSYSNLEAMISSIYSNAEIIDKMLKNTRENERLMHEKLKSYADTKQTISDENITLYQEYLAGKAIVEEQLDTYRDEINTENGMKQLSIEIYKSDADYSSLHKAFNRINSVQIKIMELLCSILCKANRIVAVL